ncbi:MAG: YqhQ protein [Fibrobacteria bacterium]|jgi:uncharacterized protein YqhQ|nr:YqhQ protein [Fibrobacteria bacterium]
MTLRSLLLRIHAGWVHLLNIEASDAAENTRGPEASSVSTGSSEPKLDELDIALDPIGGQAVVEGVLMRAPGRIAIAARAPDGTIAIQSREFVPFAKRHPLLALPILRGAASLIEALYIGTQALNWSAGIQENKPEAALENAQPSSLGAKALAAGTLVVSFTLALGLFQLLPYGAASFLVGGSADEPQNPLFFNATAGGVRITLLLIYLYALSFLPDIRRLFQYHGAEHKSIFSHESGAGLTPGAVARQTRFHPRCGTSFILIVALTCILFFSIFDAILLHGIGYAYPNFLVRFLVHLPFVPVVAGLSFEFLKASAKHQDSKWIRPLITPGLWLQRITTREPDEKQIEVAIASAKAAIAA